MSVRPMSIALFTIFYVQLFSLFDTDSLVFFYYYFLLLFLLSLFSWLW